MQEISEFRKDNLIKNDQLAKVDFVNGVIKLTILLPARQERCEFTLKLLSDSVGTLVDYIKSEDKSIEKVQVFYKDGIRISQQTPIGSVVYKEFSIRINETTYHLEPPSFLAQQSINDAFETQTKKELEDVRNLVSKLYLHLNVEQFESHREDKIQMQLESLKNDLVPMEEAKAELVIKAKKHTNRMIWLGLGLMCIQAGVLARLTWFDYSWDIVEPISYFVSYSAVVGVYAYYVLTRSDYGYESAADRIFLRNFHKNALKNNLDIQKYNQIKDNIYSLENELKRIKTAQIKTYTNPSEILNEQLKSKN